MDAPRYPTVFRRYLSTLIDGLLIIAAMVLVAQVFGDCDRCAPLRAGLFFVILLGYEPVFTHFRCTLGQRLTGIRVRRVDDVTQPISLPAAYLRYLVKIPLGFISFLTMHFNPRRRAIHDFVARSVMLLVARPRAVATAA